MLKFIITGPSGAGKTTVADALLACSLPVSRVVTHTTRPIREGERTREHYYFLTEEVFKRLRAEGEFVETAQVYGNWYGTSKMELDRISSEGKYPLLVVDIQGAKWWQDNYPEDCNVIFLRPPSVTELRRRLSLRCSENSEGIERRVSEALAESEQFLLSEMGAGYLAFSRDAYNTTDGIIRYIKSKIR